METNKVVSDVFKVHVTDMQLWLVMQHLREAVKRSKSEREQKELMSAYSAFAKAFVSVN